MRILAVAVAAALMVGCSSISDIRSNPPITSLASARAPEEVAECIRDGWQGVSLIGGSAGGQLQKTGGRYSVIAPNTDTPWHLVDVAPRETGSSITYRFFRTWQSPNEEMVAVVSRCAR